MGKSSSSDSIFVLGTTMIAVPAGVTNAIRLTPLPGQLMWQLKYSSGSSLCYLLGVGFGATLSQTELSDAPNIGYLFGTQSEILKIDGPATFYLAAVAATAVIQCIVGKSQGPY